MIEGVWVRVCASGIWIRGEDERRRLNEQFNALLSFRLLYALFICHCMFHLLLAIKLGGGEFLVVNGGMLLVLFFMLLLTISFVIVGRIFTLCA